MAPYDLSRGGVDVHVAGWTLVRVAGEVDPAHADELVEHVDSLLAPDESVALDLRGHHGDDSALVPVVRELAGRADRSGARLVVVAADRQTRTALTAAGIDAHESLDDACRATGPVLIEAEHPPGPEPLAPGTDDALRPQ